MSRPKQKSVKEGKGKHRTVGMSMEEPWFKKRRAKNRARHKIATKSRQANRRGR